MEEETIKIKKLKVGKCNKKNQIKQIINQNSTVRLHVKWEVCEKSTFLSLCQAKEAVGV
jgi:hypothetical protein